MQSVQLEFTDFSPAELTQQFGLSGLDPGRTQVFTASWGHGQTSHQVRRCSTKEYTAMSGTKNRNLHMQLLKREAGIDIIESQIPTAKTASLETYQLYVHYILEHLDNLMNFYDSTHGVMRFNNYRGKQKAREAMAAMITTGGMKYDRRKRKNKSRKRRRRRRNKERRQLFLPRPGFQGFQQRPPPVAP